MTSVRSASFMKIARPSSLLRFKVIARLLRCRVWKSGPWRRLPVASTSSPEGSILITCAPQSASWRTAVGPARCAVRSMTRKSLRGSGVIGLFSRESAAHPDPLRSLPSLPARGEGRERGAEREGEGQQVNHTAGRERISGFCAAGSATTTARAVSLSYGGTAAAMPLLGDERQHGRSAPAFLRSLDRACTSERLWSATAGALPGSGTGRSRRRSAASPYGKRRDGAGSWSGPCWRWSGWWQSLPCSVFSAGWTEKRSSAAPRSRRRHSTPAARVGRCGNWIAAWIVPQGTRFGASAVILRLDPAMFIPPPVGLLPPAQGLFANGLENAIFPCPQRVVWQIDAVSP